MKILAVVLLLGVAGFGSLMGSRISAGTPYPASWGPMHGAGAALALIMLLIALLQAGTTLGWIAFIVLAAGFAGGALLFGVLYRNKARPKAMVMMHGGIATLGLILLLIDVIG